MVSEAWKNKAVEFVRKFQQATGLVVDGMAGDKTNAKLDELLRNQGSDENATAIKAAWNKFMEAIK